MYPFKDKITTRRIKIYKRENDKIFVYYYLIFRGNNHAFAIDKTNWGIRLAPLRGFV